MGLRQRAYSYYSLLQGVQPHKGMTSHNLNNHANIDCRPSQPKPCNQTQGSKISHTQSQEVLLQLKATGSPMLALVPSALPFATTSAGLLRPSSDLASSASVCRRVTMVTKDSKSTPRPSETRHLRLKAGSKHLRLPAPLHRFRGVCHRYQLLRVGPKS